MADPQATDSASPTWPIFTAMTGLSRDLLFNVVLATDLAGAQEP
ncbi:hypothetical protein [Streptosporangium sp. V21-05]